MSDLQWLQAQLDRHTYRPDWTLVLSRVNGPSVWTLGEYSLRIQANVLDSYGSGRVIQVVSLQRVPEFVVDRRDEREFTRWLQHVLFDVELHESREWLRRDGVLVEDPHAAGSGVR